MRVESGGALKRSLEDVEEGGGGELHIKRECLEQDSELEHS